MDDHYLNTVFELIKAQSLVNRRFDARLSVHGLGFTDLIVLYQLAKAPTEKLRRIDLAEAIGATASGVTRMLAPMEKMGLVTRDTNLRDARVSFVVLAPAGKRVLEEALETAKTTALELFKDLSVEQINSLFQTLIQLR